MKSMKKYAIGALVLALCAVLCGCAMTVEEMYCLPKRPERYDNLQAAMDPVMGGLDYAAPSTGENQQTVQTADLDGDGTEEVIVFARGEDEHPLKILLFRRADEGYALMSVIESSGTGFDQVEYAQMDGLPGLEMVVGRQVSDQVLANVSVYRFSGGQPEQMMNSTYRKYLICDLDGDGLGDLVVLTGGAQETDNSIAERYTLNGGTAQRSGEAKLSRPVDQLKRIMVGSLYGGQTAVFVASTVDASTIVTDVFSLVDGMMTNVSLSSEAGTSVKTLRNYYVYADDIDGDGEMELPSLITMRSPETRSGSGGEHLIRWYAMTRSGGEVDKLFTYHNYLQGWYLELSAESVERICVTPEGNGSFRFGLWDLSGEKLTDLWVIDVLTGEDRSAVAVEDGRFVLYKSETVVYACRLEMGARELDVTQEMLTGAFHLIQSAWYTGEM